MRNERQLLAEFTDLITAHGLGSDEERQFFEEHQTNAEFVELAEVTRRLASTMLDPGSCRDNHSLRSL